MTKLVRISIYVVAFLFLSVSASKADTVSYSLSGPAISASFDVTQNPTVLSSSLGQDFIVQPSNLILDGFSLPNTIEFYNIANDGGVGLVIFGTGFQLDGPQLYTGSELAPTLLTGTFTLSGLFDISYALVANDPPSVPEPATLSLLAFGMISLGLMRRRRAVNQTF